MFNNTWDSFYNTNPEDILLILKGGKVVLLDNLYGEKFNIIEKTEFDLIEINGNQEIYSERIKETC